MKPTDKYHRWVSWSDEDGTYIGRCPDLFRGGVHDNDPIRCAERLQDAIDDVGSDFTESDNWPAVTVIPARQYA
jgi:hypothetical protein